jgi:WD40 repeat protein
VAFAPCGTRVATASTDSTAMVWSAASGAVELTLAGHARGLTSLSFSADGRRIASGGSDGQVVVWCAATGAVQRALAAGGLVFSVAWAPDGRSLAAGGFDHKVRLWDVGDGEMGAAPARVLEGHTHLVLAVATPPRTKWTRRVPHPVLIGHAASLSQVGFAPDGRTIASSSYDRAVREWDPSTGRLRRCLRGHDRQDTCVCSAPGHAQAALGARAACTVAGHRGAVSCVAYSPDGRAVASGSWEGCVKLWGTKSGTLQRSVCLGSKVTSVAFGREWLRNDKRLAFASALHPRLGGDSQVHTLDPEILCMILDSLWPPAPGSSGQDAPDGASGEGIIEAAEHP